MQINENPHPAMSMQRIMTWGHDFPKDKGVGMLTLILVGENPCVMRRTHQNCQLPSFLSSFQTFILSEGGWGSYCLEGEGYGKFQIGQSTQSWNVVFCLHGQENTKNRMPVFTHVFMLGFTLTFWERQNVLAQNRSIFLLHSREALQQHRSSCVYPSCSASV